MISDPHHGSNHVDDVHGSSLPCTSRVTVRCTASDCRDRAVPYLVKVSGRHELAPLGYGTTWAWSDGEPRAMSFD